MSVSSLPCVKTFAIPIKTLDFFTSNFSKKINLISIKNRNNNSKIKINFNEIV